MGKRKREPTRRLPEKLKQIRLRLELRQEDIARLVTSGLVRAHRATISEYESGKYEPSLAVLHRYCIAAKIRLEFLADDSLDLPL